MKRSNPKRPVKTRNQLVRHLIGLRFNAGKHQDKRTKVKHKGRHNDEGSLS